MYVLQCLPYSVVSSAICIVDPLFLVHSKAGHIKLIYIYIYIYVCVCVCVYITYFLLQYVASVFITLLPDSSA